MEPVHSAPPASSGVVRLLVKLAFLRWLSPHGFRVPSANLVRTFRNARSRELQRCFIVKLCPPLRKMVSTSRAKMYQAPRPPPLSLSIVRVKGHTWNYCAEGGRSLGTRLRSVGFVDRALALRAFQEYLLAFLVDCHDCARWSYDPKIREPHVTRCRTLVGVAWPWPPNKRYQGYIYCSSTSIVHRYVYTFCEVWHLWIYATTTLVTSPVSGVNSREEWWIARISVTYFAWTLLATTSLRRKLNFMRYTCIKVIVSVVELSRRTGSSIYALGRLGPDEHFSVNVCSSLWVRGQWKCY